MHLFIMRWNLDEIRRLKIKQKFYIMLTRELTQSQNYVKKTENCYRTVTRILKLYETMGTDPIYQCKRGKRIHHLEQISDELEAYFDENPSKDVPDAVRKIKENFGIPITATPVRYWLKAKAIRTKSQKAYLQKQT